MRQIFREVPEYKLRVLVFTTNSVRNIYCKKKWASHYQ